MFSVDHVCPEPDKGMIPLIIARYANDKNGDQIISWLEQGGDINAADDADRTVVHLACGNNQADLLRKLLQRPDVHLGQRSIEGTPLAYAVNEGSVECVEILLNAQSKCRLILNKSAFGEEKSLIQLLNFKQVLKSVPLLLKHGHVLDEDDAIRILDGAMRFNFPGLIQVVAEQDFPITRKGKYPFMDIYQMDLWSGSGMERIFKKAVDVENDYSLEILGAVFSKRDWKTLETLLKFLGNVKLHIDLAKSALAKDAERVKKLLAEPENLMEDVLNGVLLVVAIGGTSEEVMKVLLDQKPQNPLKIMNKCLILACMYNSIGVLVSLLQRESFSMAILERARALAPETSAEMIIKHAIKRCLQDTLPLNIVAEQ